MRVRRRPSTGWPRCLERGSRIRRRSFSIHRLEAASAAALVWGSLRPSTRRFQSSYGSSHREEDTRLARCIEFEPIRLILVPMARARGGGNSHAPALRPRALGFCGRADAKEYGACKTRSWRRWPQAGKAKRSNRERARKPAEVSRATFGDLRFRTSICIPRSLRGCEQSAYGEGRTRSAPSFRTGNSDRETSVQVKRRSESDLRLPRDQPGPLFPP